MPVSTTDRQGNKTFMNRIDQSQGSMRDKAKKPSWTASTNHLQNALCNYLPHVLCNNLPMSFATAHHISSATTLHMTSATIHLSHHIIWKLKFLSNPWSGQNKIENFLKLRHAPMEDDIMIIISYQPLLAPSFNFKLKLRGQDHIENNLKWSWT